MVRSSRNWSGLIDSMSLRSMACKCHNNDTISIIIKSIIIIILKYTFLYNNNINLMMIIKLKK